MSDEESFFLTALAADPHDYTTRLVFADLLCENERYADESRQRAIVEGLRGMAALGRKAVDSPSPSGGIFWRWWDADSDSTPKGSDDLPRDWLTRIVRYDGAQWDRQRYTTFPTLTAALEACALAFTRLPAARRAELLESAKPHFTPTTN